jgi:hypothetical protein
MYFAKADAAFSLARWAARNGEDICVVHSSSLPQNLSSATLHMADTNMLFWKPPPGLSHADCHPTSPSSPPSSGDRDQAFGPAPTRPFICAEGEQCSAMAIDDWEVFQPDEDGTHEGLKELKRWKRAFKFFDYDLKARCNRYMELVGYHEEIIPNEIRESLKPFLATRTAREQSYSEML